MVETISSGSSGSSEFRGCDRRLKFLIDKNLSEHLSSGLKAFGENVIHLTEVLPGDTKDPVLLEYLGTHEIFLITRDENIRWHPAEAILLRRYCIGAFFLGGKNRGRCDMILQLVRNWPRIKDHAKKKNKPFIFRIPPTGSKFINIPL
jgi:hypothetical protein